jgi:hypothetical protein
VARLVVEAGRVVVRLSTSEKLAGLANDPSAPLSAVRSARVVRPAREAIRGFRAPGLGMPGLAWVGHWRGQGHDFVAVYGNHAGVVVELDGMPYARFVVSVDDPEGIVDQLTSTPPR